MATAKRYVVVDAPEHYEIQDTKTKEVIAISHMLNYATRVANALNFDYKPSDYGYKLVEW